MDINPYRPSQKSCGQSLTWRLKSDLLFVSEKQKLGMADMWKVMLAPTLWTIPILLCKLPGGNQNIPQKSTTSTKKNIKTSFGPLWLISVSLQANAFLSYSLIYFWNWPLMNILSSHFVVYLHCWLNSGANSGYFENVLLQNLMRDYDKRERPVN